MVFATQRLSMVYSLVVLVDSDFPESRTLDSRTMNDGPVTLAFTTPEALQKALEASEAWRANSPFRVTVQEFPASGKQDLLAQLEESALLPPSLIVAVEGEPLFDRTLREWAGW
jgi:hypothetical protein